MKMEALSTVVGWMGSAIIDNLVEKAFEYLGERLPADTKAELNRLKAALPKITTVMGVGEALKLKYPNSGVNAWLQQFNLAFLAAEDVLDELEYRKLEQKVKYPDQVGASSSSIHGSLKRKFHGSDINNDTLGRLRDAVKLLDQASKDVGNFYQFVVGLHVCGASEVSCRETTSFLTESNVVGRETEKAQIIEWLKKPAPDHAHISAFCIVGAGGLGKTTLAQLIFEEMSRINLFDKTIWACISTNFSVENITKKFLEELGESSHDGESLHGLQKKLNKKVHSKKLLVVLDDVWNEDKICDWEKFVAPLRSVQQESKILLTTRMMSVVDMLARVLNVKKEYLDLRGLKEQQLLLLFNKYAFHGYNPNDHKDLQKIGNTIAKKLWGSPLAAKVIGSLLNSNMDSCYWERILKCNSLISLEQAKEVADVLKLSYYHLSADLQQCFRFCSIFPQDYQFEKNKLIRMWMASGFVRPQSHGEKRPEDIGEECFNHLLRKSFFEHSNYGSENYYVMHDLMHELAQNVSRGECFREDPNNKSVNIPSTVQHISLPFCEIGRVFNLMNLRTLVITNPCLGTMCEDDYVLPQNSLKESLRVLIIEGICRFDFPEEINHLIHLRFLEAMLGSRSCFLSSIYKLYHMQVLVLYKHMFTTDYSRVETGMTNLVSLRYMDLPWDIMKNVRGVHKLTSLQELTFFVRQDSGHHIDELRTLYNLRRLCIMQIENVEDPTQAKNANLSDMKSLLSLSLNWTDRMSNSDNPELIIDNLQPHLDLRELEIKYYKGPRSPIWMRELPPLDLSSLTLSNCHSWQDLPFLAQMPHLKKLSLSSMSEVKQVDYSSDSTRNACAFPSLNELFCDNMPNWESWTGSLTCQGFPNLKELRITECPNLAKLPAIPLSLVSFNVINVGLNSLPDIYCSSSIPGPAISSPKSSLREVNIYDCPNLKSLNGFLQQENLDFQACKSLTISGCENLVRLPTSGFGKFVSLEYLKIAGCPKMGLVDNQRILLPGKLRFLWMADCGELDVTLLESASQLATLACLHIKGNATITCIPCSENAFASLSQLFIAGCDNLVQHSLMEIAQGVNPGNNMASLKINELQIPHLSLLFVEPLRSVKFVRKCGIMDCSGIDALPEQWLMQNSSTLEVLVIRNGSSLRSLPDTMVRLTALKHLKIENASLLEQIPELPPSLSYTSIRGAGGRQLV